MLFLLNDVILHVDSHSDTPPLDAGKFAALTLDQVTRLGAELYAMDPLLHQTNPTRAKRLASLILMKAPEVNAAHFFSPGQGASPSQVSTRYAALTLDILAGLNARQQAGTLSTVDADQAVWRRLAA